MSSIVAIVGRPNVGKSSIFNLLTGSRAALVTDLSGLTRDRQYGRDPKSSAILIDTGGISNKSSNLLKDVIKQTDIAIKEADILFFVVDAKDGLLGFDKEIAKKLRKTNKPVYLIINKIDSPKDQEKTIEFDELGFVNKAIISAAHNLGLGVLRELLITTSPLESIKEEVTEEKYDIQIKNCEGLKYLNTFQNNTIDLILTDPPYIISKKSGMNKHYNNIKSNSKKLKKNEKQWEKYWKKYVKEKKFDEQDLEILKQKEIQKQKYLKYGTIYGKKYAVKTEYGDWDKKFTLDILEQFIKIFYSKLKKGGTCIIFFDLWKITDLKKLLEKCKFKQIRFIEWIKTNPQPLNSSVNYLTNCREIALLGVKGGKPTFNSKYDKGIYEFPLQGRKNRFHPTQKSLKLFEELIKKHSNKGDLVVDPFLGSGTTAIASKNTDRKFKGTDKNKEYYDKIISMI